MYVIRRRRLFLGGQVNLLAAVRRLLVELNPVLKRKSNTHENSEIKILNPDQIFGDGYLVLDDYKNAHERYSILLSDRDTELTGLQKLKEYSIYRGDYEEYINYSDRLLQKYIQEDKRVSYVNELASRAFTLVFTFNKKKESNRIIEEIKSIFNGEEEDMQFDNRELILA